MEKILAVCEPSNSTEKEEIFFDDIRENLERVKRSSLELWKKISKDELELNCIKGSIPIVNMKSTTFDIPNPVLEIISSREKSNFIATIHNKESQFDIPTKNWVKSNNIEFIIELVADGVKDELWQVSPNHYSARVLSNQNSLGNVIQDLYLDTMFKEYFLKTCYKNVLNNIQDSNLSELKTNFLRSYLNINMLSDLKFYPFAKIAREKEEYDIKYLFNTWLKFLIRYSVKKSVHIDPPSYLLPEFDGTFEPKSLLPKEWQGSGSNYREYAHRGDLILVFLKKSIIGIEEKKKRFVKSLFGENPKIRSTIILPNHKFKSLSPISHLLYIIPFKIN